MLNLLDELTTEDKEKIGAYIDLYGSFGLERKSVDELLSVWAKNKTKLYHWLGNSLRVQFPFVNEAILKEEISRKIYRTFASNDSKYNNALRNMYKKFTEYDKETNTTMTAVSELFNVVSSISGFDNSKFENLSSNLRNMIKLTEKSSDSKNKNSGLIHTLIHNIFLLCSIL